MTHVPSLFIGILLLAGACVTSSSEAVSPSLAVPHPSDASTAGVAPATSVTTQSDPNVFESPTARLRIRKPEGWTLM